MPEPKELPEIDRLRAENAAFKAEKERATADEAVIAAKMRVGLSREQAIQAIQIQRANDELEAAEKSKPTEVAKAAPKK